MWNWILCKLGLRIDHNDPKNAKFAPPAWSTLHHEYRDTLQAGCCTECGGGSAHGFHHGAAFSRKPPGISTEAARMVKNAPADHPMASFTLDD